MNKKDLVRAVANKCTGSNVTIKVAGEVIDGFIAAITESLKAGESVQISGFGTFEIKSKPAREGINPKTGEKIKIAASKAPAFKFGKAYKDLF